jgi:hypothetical protein
MSTYRYRGDLRTTGDQLRLREGGSENKKPVEVRAEDTSEEIILKTPNSDGMETITENNVSKKADVLTTNKATQTLENKTLKNTKVKDGNNAYTIIASALESPVNITLPNLGKGDEFTFNDHAQTLTNKTLTQPKINEDVALTATSTDLNQLTSIEVGGNESGDVVTTDGTQTLTNKTISDLTYGQETFGFAEQSTISLVPTKVSVLISDAVEDAKITSIDSSVTKYLVISNTSSNDIQIANYNPDTAPSVNIITGSGGDIPLGVGASTTLIYDDGNSKWRVVGKTGFDGGLSLAPVSTNPIGDTNITAEVGKHYLVDSSGGTLTITLPEASSLSPSERQGATIRITDAANICGKLEGDTYPNRIVVASSGSDTINLAESDFSGAENWSALTSFNMNVSGVWVQLMLRPKDGGYEWVVDDPFWNTLGEDYVTDETLTAQYYKKTEVNSALSLKYDASNPSGFETPAQLNARDTANRNRSNHTGEQSASTISDFDERVRDNSYVSDNTDKISADGSISTHSDVNTAGAAVGNTLVWNGSAWVPGSSGLEIKSPAAGTISASISSHYVLDTSTGAYTINLPNSTSLSAGEIKNAVIRIVDSGGNANVYNITINASGSDDILLGKLYDTGTIETDTTLIFDVPGTWIQLVLSGSRWVVEGIFI